MAVIIMTIIKAAGQAVDQSLLSQNHCCYSYSLHDQKLDEYKLPRKRKETTNYLVPHRQESVFRIGRQVLKKGKLWKINHTVAYFSHFFPFPPPCPHRNF